MRGLRRSAKYEPASSTEDISAFKTRRRPWRPGFFERLPWAGVISLILALGCAVAAVSVGIVSDGKPLDYWTIGSYEVQPTVLLSIFATVANALLVFAFTQGATIHWWNSAFQGATLKQLHSSYHYGSGLTAVFVCNPRYPSLPSALMTATKILAFLWYYFKARDDPKARETH